MAIKISMQDVLPEHQIILEGSAVIAQTVLDVSKRAKKGSSSIDLPTLAPRDGQDVAVGGSLSNNNNNYGDDVLSLDRVAGDAFTISLHDEEDNILNGVEDGLKNSLKAMSKVLDSNLYVKMLAGATLAEYERTSDFYNDLVEMSKVMDIANVPYTERFLCVTPADYAALLKTKDFVRFDSKGDGSAISNGIVGEVLGFTVVRAQLSSVTETIAYHRNSAVFGWHAESIILKVTNALAMSEQYSASRKFGTKVLQSGAMIFKFGVTP